MSQRPADTAVSAWLAESLRVTAFVPPGTKVVGSTCWSEIVGTSPENASQQPQRGIEEVSGAFSGGALALSIQPARIEWRLTPTEDETKAPKLSNIGQYSSCRENFTTLATKWLKSTSAPSITRLAFGAVLVFPVETVAAGYDFLAKYMHAVKLDSKDSSDFTYSINRPRTSLVVPGLAINRLSRWFVLRMVIGQMVVGSSPEFRETQVTHAARLELDVNTADTSGKELPAEKRSAILDELVKVAHEIAEKGDIS